MAEKELVAPLCQFRNSAIIREQGCLNSFGFVSSQRVLIRCKYMSRIESDLEIRVVVSKSE